MLPNLIVRILAKYKKKKIIWIMKAHNFLIINLNLIKQYQNLVILILIIAKFNNKMIKIIKFLIYNK